MLPSIIEIIKYLGLEDKIDLNNLTQSMIIELLRSYYASINK